MSKEELHQPVFEPVVLVTPFEARRHGIATEEPVFLQRGYREKSGHLISPLAPLYLVFKQGTIVGGRQLSGGEIEKIYGFPDLKTAIPYDPYDGYVPFSGFIAAGETIGDFVTELSARGSRDFCTITEQMRVTEIKAFVEGVEVMKGFVKEFVEPYTRRSFLVIDSMRKLDRGRTRYAFGVTQEGGVLFKKLTNDDLDAFDRMREAFLKLYCCKLLSDTP